MSIKGIYVEEVKEEDVLKKRLKSVEAERDELKAEISRLEKYKKYEETADELGAMKKAFMNSGFTEHEAFQIIITLVNKITI